MQDQAWELGNMVEYRVTEEVGKDRILYSLIIIRSEFRILFSEQCETLGMFFTGPGS